jgi:acyl-CoA reductase-like NAD-dependent aldehyde dehydrogenase
MNVIQRVEQTRHPFLDGKTKRLLIDGKWVEAASGKTFESINPATSEVLAMVAEGDAEDIDRAVKAARQAFEGPWGKVKPFERQLMLLKLADLVERHFDELSMLDTLDMGAPISRTSGTRRRVIGMLRYYAGMATALHGETIENSVPGEIFSYTLKEPVGVVGAIIPWNGPLGASVWKIGPALATGCTVILKPAEVSGGDRLTEGLYAKGFFVPPTVFADVRDDMRIAQDEIFGPVLSAIPFEDINEVIGRANATSFGLGSGVWTRDLSKAHRLAKAIRAGSIWINCYQAMDPAVPFGGYKMSGYGRESGLQHLDEYLSVKAIWIKTA